MLPSLIHPLPTYVQSIQTEETIQDDDYREPVQDVKYSDTWIIPGSWKWTIAQSLRMQDTGAQEGSSGYVLMRTHDLRVAGKKIKRGDRIVGYGSGIGKVDVDVYVTALQYMGHYPDQLGPSLVRVYFKDRQPERVQPGVGV